MKYVIDKTKLGPYIFQQDKMCVLGQIIQQRNPEHFIAVVQQLKLIRTAHDLMGFNLITQEEIKRLEKRTWDANDVIAANALLFCPAKDKLSDEKKALMILQELFPGDSFKLI